MCFALGGFPRAGFLFLTLNQSTIGINVRNKKTGAREATQCEKHIE